MSVREIKDRTKADGGERRENGNVSRMKTKRTERGEMCKIQGQRRRTTHGIRIVKRKRMK